MELRGRSNKSSTPNGFESKEKLEQNLKKSRLKLLF